MDRDGEKRKEGERKGRESGVKEEERQNAEGTEADSKGQSTRGGD